MDSILMIGTGFFLGLGIILESFMFLTIALGLFTFAIYYEDYSKRREIKRK